MSNEGADSQAVAGVDLHRQESPWGTLLLENDDYTSYDYGGFVVNWRKDRPAARAEIDWKKPYIWYTVGGARDTGKSNFLEFVASAYLRHGAALLDLNGADDLENLCWLRSGFYTELGMKMAVLKHKKVQVKIAKAKVDMIDVDQFEPGLFGKYDVIMNPSSFYPEKEDQIDAAIKIYKALSRQHGPTRLVVAVVREGQDLFPSRVYAYSKQKVVKGLGVYMIRKSRHYRCATLIDSLKESSIDSDIRHTADFDVFKAAGAYSLPSDFKWIYSKFPPEMVAAMGPEQAIISARNTALGYMRVPLQPYHKLEEEDFWKLFGVEVLYPEDEDGETLDEDERQLHVSIVMSYALAEHGIRQVAAELSVAYSAVHQNLAYHDAKVARSRVCDVCEEAGSDFKASRVLRSRGNSWKFRDGSDDA